MIISGMQEDAKYLTVRYEATWAFNWETLLDFAQIFYDDIFGNLETAAYFDEKMSVTPIDTIPEGHLNKTPSLWVPRGGMALVGRSKAYGAKLCIFVYNEKKIVDIRIPVSETEFITKVKQNHSILDHYINSLEINGYVRYAKRRAFNTYARFVSRIDGEDKMVTAISTLVKECEKVGAEPFPNTLCPICDTAFNHNKDVMLTALCPKCGHVCN